jgi:SAM-dependent methyltransferase
MANSRSHRPLQFVLGLEGIALLRGWLVGENTVVDERIARIARLIATPSEGGLRDTIDVAEMDVRDGYAMWSATYDDRHYNGPLMVEERGIRPILRALPPALALDAACGTGRHADFLATLGHRVVGIDFSPEMLSVARAKVPTSPFLIGALDALPFDTGRFDVAVCSLALTHFRDLTAAVEELGRVVRKGGRIILSDIHPLLVALGAGSAVYATADGNRAFTRSHLHLHSMYLASFAQAHLHVRACFEPVFTEAEVAMVQTGNRFAPQSIPGAFLGLPAVLIWDLDRQ